MSRIVWIVCQALIIAPLFMMQCSPHCLAGLAVSKEYPHEVSDSLRHSSRKNFTMVTGRILSKSERLPMPDANILIQGTSEGTFSGNDGRFSFQVPVNTTLVISHVGYLTERFTIGLGGEYEINLKQGVFHIPLPQVGTDNRLQSSITRSPRRMVRAGNKGYMVLEQMPNFVYGGFAGLAMDIKQKTMAFSDETGLKGRVNIGFTIRANTEVTDFYVLQSDHPDLIDAAESIIRQVNGWIPGKQRGKPVDVRVSMIIDFE
jgi:hypothetical protein